MQSTDGQITKPKIKGQENCIELRNGFTGPAAEFCDDTCYRMCGSFPCVHSPGDCD